VAGKATKEALKCHKSPSKQIQAFHGLTTIMSMAIAEPPKLLSSKQLTVSLRVNGQSKTLTLESRVTLLDALREHLQLTGTKKGCDHGQCGACTVLVNGARVNACLSFAIMHEGKEITTIEGLASGERPHPVQAAFMDCDGFQCGYCTPGQIMSAVALLSEPVALDDDSIRENMSGNICRCGAYPNILAAVRRAAGKERP
jgi:xanthine dehydrogenase YagT iron-sulfur-binding subunit